MSFDILRNMSLNQRHDHGINMCINQKFNILKVKQKNLDKNWTPVNEQSQKILNRFLNGSIEEISLKEQLCKEICDMKDITKTKLNDLLEKMEALKEKNERMVKFELDKKNGLCTGHAGCHHSD